jgi:hypothetical protein
MKDLKKVLESQISKSVENLHYEDFLRGAVYLGNGVYTWRKQYSTDTRELFLMGIACIDIRLNEILKAHETSDNDIIDRLLREGASKGHLSTQRSGQPK